MSARKNLHAVFCSGDETQCALLDGLIDNVKEEHAHELAEQQREALEHGPGTDWDYATGRSLADLIDPHSEETSA